jgi:dihydroorotate dehydrogenase (NAD+) catalytic subunit
MADLTTDLGKLLLSNPVMTASGTFGYGKEYAEYYPLEKLGAVVVKGIAPFPSHGNPTPRVAEVTSGMLNAIGLQGPGIDKFLNAPDYMPFLRTTQATVIVNIWGKTVEDYALVARRLDEEPDGIHALEINISCPNVKEGGVAFGTDLKLAAKVVSEVRKVTSLPLITKLSPNVTDIASFAKCVVDAGSDMVSLINTLPAMSIDIETRKTRIANIKGGLSGPAIKPVAVRMVYDVASAVDVPVIGMGGIMTAEDAIEFFLAGADAVAVGTAIFADPMAPLKVIDGINNYLDRHNIAKIADLVGQIIV